MGSKSIAAAAGVVPARDVQLENSQALYTGSINTEENAQENIAKLAYALWQSRGCPAGSAEKDWAEAEQQLLHSSKTRSASVGR